MDNCELDDFRHLLEAKRNELLLMNSHRDEIVIEAAADEIDRRTQQADREVAIGILDRASRLLKSVEAALDRMEHDIYGVCLRCEESIAQKRLKAIPWAPYCVGCQEAIDREHMHDEDDEHAIEFAA